MFAQGGVRIFAGDKTDESPVIPGFAVQDTEFDDGQH